MHLGGSPSQRPPSSVRQTLSAPPSSLYPLTHEYLTLVGSERVTRLDTGCSGSPHAVESGTREGRERMRDVGSEMNEECVCTRCVGVMIIFLILNGKRTLSFLMAGSGRGPRPLFVFPSVFRCRRRCRRCRRRLLLVLFYKVHTFVLLIHS